MRARIRISVLVLSSLVVAAGCWLVETGERSFVSRDY
jgi:hypothetical protein